MTHFRHPHAQVITGSHDKTVKMWDLRKGKTLSTLTYHKKSIRAMAAHPQEFAFAAASADNIKKYRLPQVESLVIVIACCPGRIELVQMGAPACCSVC